jgi:signal transduction histidine kinase/CheY-like chemotaxis protein
MDEIKINVQQKEEMENLKLQNKKLEILLLEQFNEFEKAKAELEERVEERTFHLNEQKKRLQAITDSVPGVVFQFYSRDDGESGVRYTSSKLLDIFGLEFTDDPQLLLQNFITNIHEDHRQSFIDSVQEVVEKKIPWRWKGQYVKPSGRAIWFEGNSLPTVRKGELCFDGLLFDITEKIEHEEQRLEGIRQQEQLKRIESLKTMAGAIAHRFNNAMMAVQGNLELMIETLPGGSVEREIASEASLAARGASQVGATMLRYVGQQSLNLKELSLASLVRESVTSLKNIFYPAISLNVIQPDQPFYCSMDQQLIKEVVEIILINAVESFEDGPGTVEISFGTDLFAASSFPIAFQDDSLHDGMYTFCQIQDSGHGISPEALSRIFEPFYTTRFIGRGLGLALTVGIMETHHGAVTIETTPDKGTTVRILLPSISSTRQTIPLSDGGQSEPVQLSGNILLADDEFIVLATFKLMLERLGFTVYTAVNGQDAVNLVGKQDIDFCAAVLDISMPVMDGIEAMGIIRKISPAIPILLCSGYSENDCSFQEESGGRPDCFLSKPFQISDMRSSLEKLLS